jgi:hypothetical protein
MALSSALSISESNTGPLALALRVYGFSGLMLLHAIVPTVNALMYSPHGGLGWFFIPFTFPYVLARLGYTYWRSSPRERLRVRQFALVSVPIYVIVTAPLSWIAAYSFSLWTGASLPWRQFWALLLLPVSLLALLFR